MSQTASQTWSRAIGLPPAALEQHMVILGKTRSGKTYAAKGAVEELIAASRPTCIVDPTGAWWGLRIAGTGPGLPVVILGGRHGDAPLPALSGDACARLVAERKAPLLVCDTSDMTVGERTRWFTDFAGALFRLNRQALHLVLDEAHVFAPQGKIPDPQTGAMLHAANTLASGGGSRGIRLIMITQRPAKLHKDALTCADTMIAMRVIAPQDRDAIDEWVQGAGDKKRGAEIAAGLAQLKRGEGWVWYPDAEHLKLTRFPPIRTFDSSRTPEHGEELAPAPDPTAVDLTTVTSAIAAAAAEAAEHDPKSLKARAAELTRKNEELRRQLAAAMNAPVADTDKRVRGLEHDLAEERKRTAALIEAARGWRDKLAQLHLDMQDAADDAAQRPILRQAVAAFNAACMTHPPPDDVVEGHAAVAGEVDGRLNGRARTEWREPSEEPPPEVSAERYCRLLHALAWWRMVGINEPRRDQVAAFAGYSPRGGAFSRYLSALVSAGLVSYPSPGTVALTARGEQTAAKPIAPPSLAELHDQAREIVSPRHRKILDVVLTARGTGLGRTYVAEQAGFEASGGAFNRYVSALSSAGLVTYPKRTTIAAAAWLFPEGIR